jgi:outer membrane protein
MNTVQKCSQAALGRSVLFSVLGAMTSIVVVAGASRAQAQDAMKFGYVDLQKAIQETSTGKKAKSELEKEFNVKKGELQKRETDLKKMAEDLEKKKVALSDEMKAKKQQELQQDMMKFQREVGESQMNIQKKERELTEPILKKLQGSLDKIAKDKGLSMVLEKSEQSVLWAKKELDLTDDLVKEYERTEGGKKK